MGLKSKFTVKKDNTEEVLKILKELFRDDVLVGIPEQQASRRGGDLNNAEIAYLNTEGVRNGQMRSSMDQSQAAGASYTSAMNAYLHTHGSPHYNVPPRPFLIPALEDCRADLTRKLKAIIQTALQGKATRPGFMALGEFAKKKVKAWFTNPKNGWPPNAPLTIKLKGSSRPLIDTGQLRNAINYVIETR